MKNSKYTVLFEKDLIFKGYSQNTIKNYVSQVDLFLRFFKDKDSPKQSTNILQKMALPI